jgi:hypothetical protein
VRTLAVAALVLALAGCGDAQDAATGPGDGADTTQPATPATSLTVTVMPNGTEAASMEYTLECDPAGGTHPLSEAACAALDTHPEALEPVPPDTACTMQFGGPDQATIVGTYKGEDVNSQFNRAGGCEIERWDALAPMFKIVVG